MEKAEGKEAGAPVIPIKGKRKVKRKTKGRKGASSEFSRWLRKIGWSWTEFQKLPKDDDWLFIIKLHAYLELAMNQVLVFHFDKPELGKVIAKLPTSDQGSGKLAFFAAIGLLPKPQRSFVVSLSEIRNKMVHEAMNVGCSIKDVMDRFKPDKRKDVKRGFEAPITDLVQHFKESQKDVFELSPKFAIFLASSVVFQSLALTHGLIRLRRKKLKRQLNLAKLAVSPLLRHMLEGSLSKE